MKKKFYLLDVFSSGPFSGNQLAVFPDAQGLTDLQMQSIAKEFNFSESAFVFPSDLPSCDWRVRIFTPGTEVPFAGHPTLGAAHVLKEIGAIPGDRAIIQEKVGPIAISYSKENWITIDFPKPVFGPVFEIPEKIAPIVSLKSEDLGNLAEGQIISCGISFLILPTRDRATLDSAKIDIELHDLARKTLKFDGVYLWCPGDRAGEYYTRMLAPGLGISEDPATGSAAGAFVCYLLRHGVEELHEGCLSVQIYQGQKINRPSYLKAQAWWDETYTKVAVGGQSYIIGQGELFL